MFRFIATFTALVLVISAIVTVSAPVMGRQIETTPCALTVESAARHLTGDMANTVYFTQGHTDDTVWYDGPEILVTGRRDIYVQTYDPHGDPLLRGRSHVLSQFMATCLPRPQVPFRWRLGESCKANWSFRNIMQITGSTTIDGWHHGYRNGDYWYQGDPLSFWVPRDLLVWNQQGSQSWEDWVKFTPGYKVEGFRKLYFTCTSDYWRSR